MAKSDKHSCVTCGLKVALSELRSVVVGVQDRGSASPGWIVHRMCPPCAQKYYEGEAAKHV